MNVKRLVPQIGPRLARSFSATSSTMGKLRIGFVPEHFSTPLAFARTHYGLDAEFIPIPDGTGTLAKRLKTSQEEDKLDLAVGLTEGFVADLGKERAAGNDPGYGIAGTYVESPLCWGITTGGKRQDVNSVEDLKGSRVGVSRIGSGSYVMSYVLADQKGWLQTHASTGELTSQPFDVVPRGTFAHLRNAVNRTEDGAGEEEKAADFFMWEHFTTKHFWDSGEVKRIGEIYTPWPSWMITARNTVAEDELRDVMKRVNQGVRHYLDNTEESVKYITSTMEYSDADARAWMKTVKFADDTQGVDLDVIKKTVEILVKAGVLGRGTDASPMIRLKR